MRYLLRYFKGCQVSANYFNLNIVQFWFYMTYQEAACVVSDSKNDVPYQMTPPGSQYMVLTPPIFYYSKYEKCSHNQFCEAKVCWYPIKAKVHCKGTMFCKLFSYSLNYSMISSPGIVHHLLLQGPVQIFYN